MPSSKPSFKDLLTLLKTKRMLTVLLLGFSSGLPIMVVFKSIKLWLRRYEIDLSTIGYISWIAIPYSYNFLWAFLFDRFTPFKKFGRRRSWLLLTQVLLCISFFFLSFGDPSISVAYIAIVGTALCFFSASQDVAVDAYRNEILNDKELGVGGAIVVYGYRVAMWVAAGFGIWIVDEQTWGWSFNQMFMLMGAFVFVGIFTTLWADEPENQEPPLKSFKDSVVMPFIDFFRRPSSLLILLFILLYKLGDSVTGSMTAPFYADLGFTNKDIGEISSTVGFFSTLAGLFVGGGLIFKRGYFTGLWVSGFLQAFSTVGFVFLATFVNKWVFASVVFFEDFASGMGTASLVAFMGHLTSRRFTATQYALFASLASMGKTFFSGFSGKIIELFQTRPLAFEGHAYGGWIQFFILGGLIAIPGLICLHKLSKVGVTSQRT